MSEAISAEAVRKVVAVVLTADGGCPGCVGDLLERLEESLPAVPWRDVARELDPPWGDDSPRSVEDASETLAAAFAPVDLSAANEALKAAITPDMLKSLTGRPNPLLAMVGRADE